MEQCEKRKRKKKDSYSYEKRVSSSACVPRLPVRLL